MRKRPLFSVTLLPSIADEGGQTHHVGILEDGRRQRLLAVGHGRVGDRLRSLRRRPGSARCPDPGRTPWESARTAARSAATVPCATYMRQPLMIEHPGQPRPYHSTTAANHRPVSSCVRITPAVASAASRTSSAPASARPPPRSGSSRPASPRTRGTGGRPHPA